MRSTSIFFHPRAAPTVEHVTTAAGDAVLLEAGGMAFTFRDFPELERWLTALTLAVDIARATEMERTLSALREVSRLCPGPEPQGVLVAGGILAQGARS